LLGRHEILFEFVPRLMSGVRLTVHKVVMKRAFAFYVRIKGAVVAGSIGPSIIITFKIIEAITDVDPKKIF